MTWSGIPSTILRPAAEALTARRVSTFAREPIGQPDRDAIVAASDRQRRRQPLRRAAVPAATSQERVVARGSSARTAGRPVAALMPLQLSLIDGRTC